LKFDSFNLDPRAFISLEYLIIQLVFKYRMRQKNATLTTNVSIIDLVK